MGKFSKILLLIVSSAFALPSLVQAQVKVPFTMDESTFFSESVTFKSAEDNYMWSDDAIKMASDGLLGAGCGLCWPDRYFTVEISGVPDVISFSTSTSSFLCTYKLGSYGWEVEQSVDGRNWSTVWGSKSQSNSVSEQLDKDTRFVRVHDRYNYSGYVRDFTISSCHYVRFRSEGKQIAEFGPFRNGDSLSDVHSPSPEKDCQKFIGWDKVLPDIMGASDIILNAQFETVRYTSTFRVSDDGKDDYEMSFDCGQTVDVKNPSREGFTFVNWSPSLPVAASDALDGKSFFAQWSRNSYVFRYVSDTDTFPLDVAYGDAIPSAPTLAKEGYTFVGWSPEVPDAMPSHDFLVDADWKINRYLLTLRLFGDSVWTDSVEYRSVGSLPVPARKGYTFAGWDNLPETMPAHDIEISALWTPNVYRLSAMVADDVSFAGEYHMGDLINIEDTFSVPGYSIVGWIPTLPALMPDSDMTVTAVLKPNRHLLSVLVDSAVVFSDSLDFSAPIDLGMLTPTDSVGFLFEWESPAIVFMPDSDVVLSGTYVRQRYPLLVHDAQTVWQDTTYYYGDTIRVEAPSKRGWSVLNWTDVPSVMPAHSVDVALTWSAVQYSISMVVGEKELFSSRYLYNDTVMYPSFPDSTGYRLYWSMELPRTMPDSDIVILGFWDEYKMLFRLVDEGDTYFHTYYHEGESIPSFDDLEREGYTFLSWSPKIPEVMPDSDFVSVAQWRRNMYPLTLMVDGNVALDTMFYYHDTIDFSLFPSRLGYSLSVDSVPLLMPARPLALSCTWSLNYHRLVLMDADAIVVDSFVAFGEKVRKDSLIKAGYTFDGWSPSLPENMPDSEFVAYARWRVNQYRLVVKTQTDMLLDSMFSFHDTVPTIQLPEREGYTLYLSREIPSFMPADSVLVEAMWIANEHHFVLKDGEGIIVDSIVAFGREIVFGDAIREGYDFKGWSPHLPDVMPDSDFAATAIWEIGRFCLVTLVGDDTLHVDTFDFGETLPLLENPFREGCRFEWLDTFPINMPARDLEVRGRFFPLSFPFVVLVDGDTVRNTTYAFGDLIDEVTVPEKTGYSFVGWSDSLPKYMPASPVTLTAKWTINQYAVRILDDGISVWDTLVEYGAALPDFPDLQKEGYAFTGWDTLVSEMPSHDVDIHAEWTVNRYSITLMLVSMTTQKMLGLPKRLSFSYGEKINIGELELEGYRFCKWNNECPETMPAKNFALIAMMEPVPEVVGEEKIGSEEFLLYVTDGGIVVLSDMRKADVTLWNMAGKVIYHGEGGFIEVPLSGTYIVKQGDCVRKVSVK